MIQGIHHSSITVRDLDRSVDFYGNVLGLPLLYTAEGGGEEVSRGVGVSEAQVRIAMFEVGEDLLELIEYVHPKTEPAGLRPCDVGSMHVAFRVTDIHQVYEDLRGKGVKFNAPPIETTEGPLKGWIWAYFSDPDGAQLELVEVKPSP